MNRLTALMLCVALSVAGSLATAPAAEAQLFAKDRVYLQSRSDRGRSSDRERVRISLDQAANMVRRRTKGKVIGSSTRRDGSRTTYRIKVLKDGNVRTCTVDANSGSIGC